MKNRIRGQKGQILAGVVMISAVLLIIVPAMVYWVQQDMRASVKDRKTTAAFNLAEAGVDRAYWKLKSSTSTWAAARAGVPISGYAFDQSYRDVAGGVYRVSVTSGPLPEQVTVVAEGRDNQRQQIRAVRALYSNLAIPGAIISGAGIAESGSSIAHWGPMMAMNNITLSGTAANRYFPRKLSKQVVTGTVGNPRDVNGLTPPNTDNLEWWSNYEVPELPIFDFAALRSSAAASGTLNCNGSALGPGHTSTIPCGSACVNCSVTNLYKDSRYNDNLVWYWDNNASWTGSNGIKGTVIVRGNLNVAGGDFYVPATMKIPAGAWQEYQRFDTAASNQYPGDVGLHSSTNTYVLGSCGVTCEGSASGSDLGLEGFMYVGGTINMTGDSDVHGAIWVQSGWSGGGNVMVFYDDSLVLPQLNVTLQRLSWQEVAPAAGAW
jgi:hypothetical protein